MTHVIISANGCIIWDKVTLANNPWLRLRGLLGRKSLAKGEGLLLEPCRQVHGFFMKIPLDLVFLDQDGHVLKIEQLLPWHISSFVPSAHAILEVAAGSAVAVHSDDELILQCD